MWEHVVSVAQYVAIWAGWGVVWLLCAAGVLLSAVGISGTWLVLGACAIAAPLTGSAFPGWGIVAIFAAAAVAVDTVEWFAGHWGVRRRGGSRLAGLAAILGGLAGLVLGTLALPVVGSFLGMVAGSFALAYVVERRRLKSSAPAAHIATGAVLACVAMLLLKVLVTLCMALWLLVGVLSS